MDKTFILLRFYEGGGLADYKIVKCNEDDLYDECVEFEKDCVNQNLGTHLALLEEEEIEDIYKELKGDKNEEKS